MELVLINISWHEICIKSTNKNIRCHFKWQFINTFFYIFSNIWYFAYMFIYYMCICLELNLSNFTFSMGWIQLQMTIVNEFKNTWHKRHRRILNKVSIESNFNCRKPFYSILLCYLAFRFFEYYWEKLYCNVYEQIYCIAYILGTN